MDGVSNKHKFIKALRISSLLLGAVWMSLFSGCRLGRNDPYVQNAIESFRIERDAAEDRYYQLKQENDEANWQIEALEKKLKQLEESTVSSDGPVDLEPEELSYSGSGSEYSNTEFVEDYPRDQVSTSVGFNQESSDSIVGIEIDPNLTRGYDSQGKTGDDGIMVVIRPVNENGEFIPKPGAVTLSLLDPAQKGIRQRVGLWKFSSAEVESRFDQKHQAMVFRLPWQRNIPKNSDLKLFVRYQSPVGKLEVDSDLKVVLDGQPNSRWTKIQKNRSVANRTPARVNSIRREDDSPSVYDRNRMTTQNPQSILEDRTILDDQPGPRGTRIARPEWSPVR